LSTPPTAQASVRPLTSLPKAACVAAPQRVRLAEVPQDCCSSGASMPASRTVVPATRTRSPPMASARPCNGLLPPTKGSWPAMPARFVVPLLPTQARMPTAATPTPMSADPREMASARGRGRRKPPPRNRAGRGGDAGAAADRQGDAGLAAQAGAARTANPQCQRDGADDRDRPADLGPGQRFHQGPEQKRQLPLYGH